MFQVNIIFDLVIVARFVCKGFNEKSGFLEKKTRSDVD